MREDVRPDACHPRVAHGRAVGEIHAERDEPERGEQCADRADRDEDPPGVLVPVGEREQDSDCGIAERRDDVAEERDPVQAGRQPTEPPRSQREREDAEEQQSARESEGEGELAGERRGEVPAFDVVGGVEQKRQHRQGHQNRDRPPEASESSEGPSRHRERDRAEDRDELEGNRIGEHDRERGDEQGGQGKIEDVQREALEPLRVPARYPSVGEQVVDEVVRRHDMTGVVAADIHVRAEEQAWSQLPDDEDRRSDDCDEPEGLCDRLAACRAHRFADGLHGGNLALGMTDFAAPRFPMPATGSHDASARPRGAAGAAW